MLEVVQIGQIMSELSEAQFKLFQVAVSGRLRRQETQETGAEWFLEKRRHVMTVTASTHAVACLHTSNILYIKQNSENIENGEKDCASLCLFLGQPYQDQA